MAALRAKPGDYVLQTQRRDGFVLRGWRRELGIEGFSEASGPVACDNRGCRLERDGRSLAIAFRPNALVLDCGADLVLNLASDTRCPGRITVTRSDLREKGALAVHFSQPPRLTFVDDDEGRRPWQRPDDRD